MRVFFASAPVKTRAALPTRVVRRLWRVANARPALAGVASTDEPPMNASASAELHPHVSHVLFSEDVLRSRIQEMACELNVAYQNGPPPLLLQVMTGAFIFAADLVRGLRIDGLEIGSVRASSYVGAGSSGEVSVSELSSEVAGKHVLLVEDIVDTGLTLSKLSELLLQQGAASVKVVTLLDKKAKRKVALVPDFSGFDCPDSFVVGYGLDYDGKLRELPYVGVLKPEIYS